VGHGALRRDILCLGSLREQEKGGRPDMCHKLQGNTTKPEKMIEKAVGLFAVLAGEAKCGAIRGKDWSF
jgi:hypothetical protein